MLMLRYAYVLALTVWLGGMVVLGAVVAPSAFGVLPALEPESGRALAGAVFGAALSRFHLVAYVAGAVLLFTLAAMAVLGPRPRSFAIRSGVIVLMLAIAFYSGVFVLGEIDAIQQEIATSASSAHALPSELAATDTRRIRFDYLHELSRRLMIINVVGGLLLLVWETRE
jgi:hypothetical protein